MERLVPTLGRSAIGESLRGKIRSSGSRRTRAFDIEELDAVSFKAQARRSQAAQWVGRHVHSACSREYATAPLRTCRNRYGR